MMPWTLADNQAVLSGPLLSAKYDLHQPREGLRDVSFAGQQLPSLYPLQVTLNPPVSQETIIETYVRGDDLMATYAQLPERTVRPQVCLRHLAAESLGGEQRAGVELIIAVQTSLLDSDPTFLAFTELSAASVFVLQADKSDWQQVQPSRDGEMSVAREECAGAFVFRLDESQFSYIELIYPSDFQGAIVRATDSSISLSYQLFPEFLEKGVIRKGRIRGILCQQADDLACGVACYEQLATAPPPLTV